MVRLKPIEDSIEDIYDECISTFKEDKKNFFKNQRETVINSSKNYIKYAENNCLKDFPIEQISNQDKKVFLKIYKDKFSNRQTKTRKYYDKILGLAPDNKCIYCGIQDANTLDHFMPKSYYWTLAITPANLIPSCSRCNSKKLDLKIESVEDLLYNPYFEDIDEYDWLKGILEHVEPPTVNFYVNVEAISSVIDLRRIENYFSIFKLNELYSIRASQRLRRITDLHKEKIKRYYPNIRTAIEEIKVDIDDNIKINSGIIIWEKALYKVLKSDSWYIDEYIMNYIKSYNTQMIQ